MKVTINVHPQSIAPVMRNLKLKSGRTWEDICEAGQVSLSSAKRAMGQEIDRSEIRQMTLIKLCKGLRYPYRCFISDCLIYEFEHGLAWSGT